ncbi:hypothetical protein B0T16DRAFT_459796 [Cercophora newfieldiana]|uniref:Uncharacterized protein n=1 Tax=Cercophora newfieldiana TaxID=92897 RepID=A0AA39Y0E2_9PEZI|nr:hypothetical protein B0T16DRAFT_459796 [Cercophora newfieldiana]
MADDGTLNPAAQGASEQLDQLFQSLKQMVDDLTSSPKAHKVAITLATSLRSRDASGNIVPQPGFEMYGIKPTNMAIANHNGNGPQLPHLTFQPSNSNGAGNGAHESANYLGDRTLARNQSANMPNDENCAFFITGLPPTCTVHILLSAIKGFGRIFSTYINPPTTQNCARPHTTAAAKVVFFDLPTAQKFYKTYRHSPLVVGKHNATVVPSRVKSAAADYPNRFTRHLVLTGPASIVNAEYVQRQFSRVSKYDVDFISIDAKAENPIELHFHFGSFRAQAEQAARMIHRNSHLFPGVKVKFGRDLCD